MKELSLHILDIAKNSVKAKATVIEIILNENTKENLLSIDITDNGCGMDAEFLSRVKDPFSTTRTTRKVGLGIPLFMAAAELCGGSLDISSEPGKGTKLSVSFIHNHIDRAPIGDMAGTMQTLISGSPDIDFIYRHIKDGEEFVLDTAELRNTLGPEVPLDLPEVIGWIGMYIQENS